MADSLEQLRADFEAFKAYATPVVEQHQPLNLPVTMSAAGLSPAPIQPDKVDINQKNK